MKKNEFVERNIEIGQTIKVVYKRGKETDYALGQYAGYGMTDLVVASRGSVLCIPFRNILTCATVSTP